ncbi:glycerophosphodiester phosphodiesterase [Vallitalea pronyensis]|uniref:Glycerophosphodiester phosphodiesterase n=1 Tax=Vallitalea pronyensis TaxID=1348613 RepID=A0A8J8MM55_9FIRM|nr:glycerophosphodiester phosphodiesterase family protein [Vallitalea pronyensis]QUI24061.1 glycerophosphodiester phosphodiesterase [Vallitalea pronyensis]
MDERMKWLAEEHIAHRGYHDGDACPENSMRAFREAIENGFGIELDVHATSDGKIVVFHDDNLRRMTGVNKDVKDCTYDEIKHLTLLKSDEHIPLFSDVLKEVNGQVGIMVELKSIGKPGLLEENTYKLLKTYKGNFIIQSFNPITLAWFKKHAPNMIRGQLSGVYKGEKLAWFKRILLKNFLLNHLSEPHFINYDIAFIDRLPIKILRKKGRAIFGWTARTKEEYTEALKKCVNVVFENFDPRV